MLRRLDGKQRFAVLHRLAVLHELRHDGPETSDSISFISFIDSMMQSTCPGVTRSPNLDERRRVRRGSLVEGSDDRRFHVHAFGFGSSRSCGQIAQRQPGCAGTLPAEWRGCGDMGRNGS